MSDPEEARRMLSIAQRDARALQAMTDAEDFATELFAFVAQQAVEKALKAWLALTIGEYPKTHDLEALFVLLGEQGGNVPLAFRQLEYLTDFAVQFRYSSLAGPADELDRPSVVAEIRKVLLYVAGLLEHTEGR